MRGHILLQQVSTIEQLPAVPHPPYSPDLAPSVFHVFGPLKDALSATQFRNDYEVRSSVRTSGCAPVRKIFSPRNLRAGVSALNYKGTMLNTNNTVISMFAINALYTNISGSPLNEPSTTVYRMSNSLCTTLYCLSNSLCTTLYCISNSLCTTLYCLSNSLCATLYCISNSLCTTLYCMSNSLCTTLYCMSNSLCTTLYCLSNSLCTTLYCLSNSLCTTLYCMSNSLCTTLYCMSNSFLESHLQLKHLLLKLCHTYFRLLYEKHCGTFL
jgi:hypothetical protein